MKTDLIALDKRLEKDLAALIADQTVDGKPNPEWNGALGFTINGLRTARHGIKEHFAAQKKAAEAKAAESAKEPTKAETKTPTA